MAAAMKIFLPALLWITTVLGLSASSQPNTTGSAHVLIHDKDYRTANCYDDLGCLVTSSDWYDNAHMPFNPTPSSREEIGTTFKLFSKHDMQGVDLQIYPDGIHTSGRFNSQKETKIIIHGFYSSTSQDWVANMTRALTGRMDVNVITVDWSNGSGSPYAKAVANARVVGLQVAYLINNLIEKEGARAQKFHLIGHSLGAHIAGYAGERVSRLGRISGLDPAGPGFSRMPTYVRLDKNDAEFVDVIHTHDSYWGYGHDESVGDIDFFPNGGRNQPGCELTSVYSRQSSESIWQKLGDIPFCSHKRAESLFLESILTSPYLHPEGVHECPLFGFVCDSYNDFLNGECTTCGRDNSGCALMGIDADKYPRKHRLFAPKKFYLNTNSFSPFCGYNYALNLTVAAESGGRDNVVGDISATVFGDKGVAAATKFTLQSRSMHKGETHKFLGFSSTNAGRINATEVTWMWNPNFLTKYLCFNCVKDLFISHLNITSLGFSPKHKREPSTVCDHAGPVDLKSGESTLISLHC